MKIIQQSITERACVDRGDKNMNLETKIKKIKSKKSKVVELTSWSVVNVPEVDGFRDPVLDC